MNYKNSIINELVKVQREGMPELIKFLETSDFFRAPASSKHHGVFPGGLAKHSLNVFMLLKEKNERFNLGLKEETMIITGLLHDACKIYYYMGKGRSYKVVDSFPVGHGEKSVFVLQRFIKLTDEEIAMIRWHMNAWDNSIQLNGPNYAFNDAEKRWKGIVAIFTADIEATKYVDG